MKKKLEPLSLRCVILKDGLLAVRQTVNQNVTVPVVLEKCEVTGRVEAILHRWDGRPESRPHPFWDSDIGKTLESVAYALISRRDGKLEEKADTIIELMVNAQEEDGYFNSYYQTCEPRQNRWSNLYYMHELYCMGHLIEGAVAYYNATGKDAFLKMMCRYADLACSLFLDGGAHFGGYCGHPEIELALVRLYETTGVDRYLELSRTFIEQRGQEPWFFEQESLKRGVDTEKTANLKRHLKFFLPSRGPYAEYQAHLPVRQQAEPVGHAVRAMYLLSGIADIADLTDDDGLYTAARNVWDTMVHTQYAITGGIGTASDGERFTFAYDLPNENTYNETCASVALVMAGLRLLQFGPDSSVADIIEQTLYNTILASVSLSGDSFFYANYLDVCPERFEHASKAMIDKMYAQRQEWFDVACCPPNVARLMGSLGQYVASTDVKDDLYVHLYTGCELSYTVGGKEMHVEMLTQYPWKGEVTLILHGEAPRVGTVWVRIPGWCQSWTVCLNGDRVESCLVNGYMPVSNRWTEGDTITVALEMYPVVMEADPRVRQDAGKVALMRGPVVYCLEEADNGGNLHDVSMDAYSQIGEREICLEGLPVVTLELEARRYHRDIWEAGQLYRPVQKQEESVTLIAVPYFTWGNRGFGEMTVWINRE